MTSRTPAKPSLKDYVKDIAHAYSDEKYDQMVQIHDYDGVSMWGGRDANQKAAASEATAIFQNYYPEFLVRHLLRSSIYSH